MGKFLDETGLSTLVTNIKTALGKKQDKLTSGTNIKTVAARLGHTQLSTTNRYVHALRDADEAAAETFAELVVMPESKETKKAE